ncbi:MAG TPA: hypothetical protein VKG43_05300, partial [Acidimicrobiales bacterium]|nr:hypothetical protein [Acidimicrobiales bacterium]
EARCGVPTLGVVPWLDQVALDAEDSMALRGPRPGADSGDACLDVAVVRFPHLSNVTDVDALALEPAVSVRFVSGPAGLGTPDLVVLPGTKSTAADLAWLRDRGLDRAIGALHRAPCGPVVLGICGGYQMLGRSLLDPDGVESADAAAPGLGWLDVETRFAPEKVTRRRAGTDPAHGGAAVEGYEIHHGRPAPGPGCAPWLVLDAADGTEAEGVADPDRGVYATSLHGVFESDAFREGFLGAVAARRRRPFAPAGLSFAAARQAQIDRLADACEAHLDLDAIDALIAEGAP